MQLGGYLLNKVSNHILDVIGSTPMVKLNKLVPQEAGHVFVKLENLNLGGSIKSRSAFNMIKAAEEVGKLTSDSIIVEPSSGNQGIGVAMIAAIKGYKARIVMPETMSEERGKLIKAYGAEVVLSPVGKDIKETFENCIGVAYKMAEEDSRVVILQQFENPANPEIHEEATGVEILEQIEGPIDAFVAAIGTGGTITGIGRVLRKAYPNILIYAVEPAKAAVLSGGEITSHKQQGIGDGFIPQVLDQTVYDGVITVEDEQALKTARDLARREGILAGISSGSNVWGAIQVAKQLGAGKKVVTIIPDTGERYLSTELFNDLLDGGEAAKFV